jgi:hypothetical protein
VQQVKIFKGIESDVVGLEKEINTWIHQSRSRVVSITGNIAPQTEMENASGLGKSRFPPSDIVIIVLYETGG